MAIIAISRGTFAGGEKLALALGAQLSYTVVSREDLFTRVGETYGVKLELLSDMLEHTPSVTDASAKRHAKRLLAALQACLCDMVSEDGVVYHGQLGHLFLPGVSHVVRVRLIAPRSQRLKMAMEREHLTEFEASRTIDRVDSERARWTRFFYGVDWSDPSLYDLLINLEAMGIDDAVELVAHATILPAFRTTEASRRRIRNLALESRIRARLLSLSETADFDVGIEADEGRVRVGGLLGEDLLQRVTDTVRAIPGVTVVEASQAH